MQGDQHGDPIAQQSKFAEQTRRWLNIAEKVGAILCVPVLILGGAEIASGRRYAMLSGVIMLVIGLASAYDALRWLGWIGRRT
jgi:hypothetical protein